jgi:hypothetical protein
MTFPVAGHAEWHIVDTLLTNGTVLQATHMINCQVSIALQEDFTLTYGRGTGLQKDYHVRQMMFGTGVTSGSGHFITAIRLQRAGRYQAGDMWQLFSSAEEPRTLSLAHLDQCYSRYLCMMLLTAKEQPADDMRPLLQAPSRPRYILFLEPAITQAVFCAGLARTPSYLGDHFDSIFAG